MKNILTKTNKTILSIFFALIVMVGVFTVMPNRSLKAKAYTYYSYTCTCEGGTYYVSQNDITSYSNYYTSWITVSKISNGYYKVIVKPDTYVRIINTNRTGIIYFKNSKGITVYSLNVKQYQPYISSSSSYLSISKAATSYAYFTIYSTCAYTIEYPSNLTVKTSTGKLISSGSTLSKNSTNGLTNYDYLRVYPTKANTGKYNLSYSIKLKKAGSYSVAKTINVTHTYY